MKKFIYNRILLLAIAIGLIASLVIAGQRHAVEINNSQIDMAMDYYSLYDLAVQEGLDFENVLQQAKEAGITSLAIYDTTLERLTEHGKIVALSGDEIITNYYSGSLVNQLWREMVEANSIDADRIYIIGRTLQDYEETKSALILRLGEERVRTFAVGEIEVLEVKAQYGSFRKNPLGLSKTELDTAKNAGFNILARPANFSQCTPEKVRAVFEKLNDYPISEIVFDGKEVLGASECIDVTAEEMKKRNYTLGLIEHVTQLKFYPQRGYEELSEKLGYDKIARLYAVPKDEQPKLPLDTIVNRWATTDHERNIRINLLRIYEKPAEDMTLLETNLKYIRDVSTKLKANGYTLGKADVFENYYPNKILRVLVVVGVVAACVLYLSLISRRVNINENFQLRFFAVLAIISAVLILAGADGKVRIIAALLSANIFPALAIIWQLDRLRFLKVKAHVESEQENSLSTVQIIWLSVASLFITSAMSLIGAAFLSGSLSDIKYFLEFEIFRGIKLTFVLPLILVAIAFLQRFNVVDEVRKNVPAIQQFKEILEMNITVKTLLGALFVLVAFVVLIARSGHTAGMPVSGAEIKIRAMLEQLFYARPRSKEIFIGHPAFVLAMAAFLKKFPKMICFILILAATIGQSSMVETFAHMRTPIFMSFMRGIDGVIPGAMIGAILILILVFAARFRKGVRVKS
ncbi:MAG: hypothetical protein IK062_03745 [Selenomonadaceae bacterium]|nr:hypothetical protein [Selenomonadaceae bacterium]